MYQLMSQWPIEQTKAAGKREQLLILLREIGKARFVSTIQRCIAEYEGEFCPTIAMLRRFVPHGTTHGKRTWWRDPNCPRCHGIGWYSVPDPEAVQLYGTADAQAVLRCDNPDCLHRGS